MTFTPEERRDLKPTDIFLGIMRATLYPAFLLIFILCLSAVNPQLLRVSRTTAVFMTTFALSAYFFTKIYGGFRIGEQKSKPIIYQMSLSVALTDIVTYFELQIMNVNEANNDSLELFGPDIMWAALAFALQLLIIWGATRLGNYLYFKAHKPKKCCVVTHDLADRKIICRKLAIFDKQFTVVESALDTDEELKAKLKGAQTVILFRLPAQSHQTLVEYCYKHEKDFYFDLSVGDILCSHSSSFLLDDVPMTVHTGFGLTYKQRFLKRAFDIIASSLGLLAASPFMLFSAVAIKLDDPRGKIIFRQLRITRNNRPFEVYKFRTMVESAESDHSATVDDARITKPGRLLRKLRFDELPQLINILKGDMSVVGPRPEMLSNHEKYSREMPEFVYRNRVKAGLTGYAQIQGKYNTDPHEKLMMDVYYIENYSFFLDIKLILKTFIVFFKKDSTEAFEGDGK